MPKLHRLRNILSALATCSMTALLQPAQAGQVVQDLNFALSPLTGFSGPAAWVATDEKSRTFQRFEPGLGTLTAARWELSSAWIAFGGAQVQSLHTDPQAAVTGILRLELGLDSRVNFAGSLLGTGGQYFSLDRQASQGCSTTASDGPCGIELEFGGGFNDIIQATDLAAFIGGADFVQGVEAALLVEGEIDSTLLSAATISSAGQLIWADRDDRGGIGRLRLVYEFDEAPGPGGSVPEPSSIALAGIALVALRRVRRRL